MQSVEIPHNKRYSIDISGNVFDNEKHRTVSVYTRAGGRRVCFLRENGVKKIKYIARLLFEAFKPDEFDKAKMVRHLDDNPAHDCLSNLAIGTHKDNVADALKNGRFHGKGARLTEDQVKTIKKLGRQGLTYSQIDRATGFATCTHIRAILNGKIWKHIT